MTDLEKMQRRVNAALIVAVLAIVAAAASLAMQARSRPADMIAFKDSTGVVAARMGMHNGELVIVDGRGAKMFGFGLQPGMASLRVYDENYRPRVRMELDDRGPQVLILSDSAKPQVRIAGMRAGADMFLYDMNGRRQMIMSTNQSGTSLLIADANRRPRAVLNTDKISPRFILYDTLNQPIFTAPR